MRVYANLRLSREKNFLINEITTNLMQNIPTGAVTKCVFYHFVSHTQEAVLCTFLFGNQFRLRPLTKTIKMESLHVL
jgi:hypothetical protein